jgi:hypothetical protein
MDHCECNRILLKRTIAGYIVEVIEPIAMLAVICLVPGAEFQYNRRATSAPDATDPPFSTASAAAMICVPEL